MTTQPLCQQCGHDQSAHRDETCRYCVRRQAANPEPEFTALFPKMDMAVAFAQALADPGQNWVTDVVQKGRKVTFNSAIPQHVLDEDGERQAREFYFLGTLERVGYYGSTQARKATLNGVKAPMSY